MNTQKKSILASSVKVALYGATALMTSLSAHNATAQEAVDENAEEVIEVRGIRGALANAAELKRESSTFMDSITASDANALPDLSVAEALSRVPGVTVTKFDIGADGGDFPSAEGSGNLIRGLGLIRSELNGRDAFTSDGSRALDWSSIPPQMIEGVDVYKNQSADLIEGGIGGSINLRTIEPFDREGFFGVVSVDGTYSDLREETTPTMSAIFSNRWETDAGEFGLLGSFSRSELKSLFNGYQSGAIVPVPVGSVAGDRFPDLDVEDFTGDMIPTEGQTVGIINGFQLRATEVDRERSNVYLAGQWRSSDESFKATVKYVRVDNEVFDLERTTEWQDGGVAFALTTADSNIIANNVSLTPYTSSGVPRCGNGAVAGDDDDGNALSQGFCSELVAVDGGLFEEGLISSNESSWYGAPGAQIGNLGIGRSTETTTDDISVNIEWAVDDQWFVEFDAHRTTSELTKRDQWIGATTHLDFRSRPNLNDPEIEFFYNDGFAFNQDFVLDAGNNVVPTAAPTSTADPAGYFMGYAADRYQDGEGDSNAVKVDATYNFNPDGDDWFQSVKFGVRRAEREQIYQDAGLNWQGVSQAWAGGIARYNAFDTVAHQTYDFADFQRGGVVVGDNTEFVYAHPDFLRNPDSFYDFLANEPDLNTGTDPDNTRTGDYSPFANGRRDANYVEQYTDGQTANVSEVVTNLYIRFDIAQDFDNGMFLEGNFGVRYVKMDIDSKGSFQYSEFAVDEQQADRPAELEAIDSIRDFLPESAAYLDQGDTDRTLGLDEDYYLPSLNLKLNLDDEWLVRLGLSQGLTLPNISDYSASQSVRAITSISFPEIEPGEPEPIGALGAAVSRLLVTGGNPDLEPTLAVNFDLAVEWYGEGGNYFSLAFFNKDIKDIVQTDTIVQVDSVALDGAEVPIFYQGAVNQSDATVAGFEISGQYFFDQLDGIWSNFGIQANYTKLDVDADSPERSLDADGDGNPDSFDGIVRIETLNGIIGQSENFANVVGMYQDDKLEVRIAYQYRDEFLNSYETFITGNPNIQDSNFSLDASVKYQITDNLQVSLQGTNLTDELQTSKDILNEGGETFQRSSFMFDRRFQFGVQYTF
ncbi:TonB-dependent receptor [Paraglaciecola arctica]|uniref:TonB-dependent receptor n=1 Tax=Paraglaciecola arctica TaxID=1128911 RepID=UPI001C06A23B|nr:TonB-dependent receptor [Paraglaciecola arctica]MBU3005992.1 TonB-dependent receptor [Paraglaciecola arctica]